MKIVKVTYKAKPEYVATNSANIEAVMADLRKLNHPGIFYYACLGADGITFTHNAFFEPAESEKALFGLASFQHFQSQLRAEGLDSPPQTELLTLAGSSRELL